MMAAIRRQHHTRGGMSESGTSAAKGRTGNGPLPSSQISLFRSVAEQTGRCRTVRNSNLLWVSIRVPAGGASAYVFIPLILSQPTK